jgi:hypothetical protein
VCLSAMWGGAFLNACFENELFPELRTDNFNCVAAVCFKFINSGILTLVSGQVFS